METYDDVVRDFCQPGHLGRVRTFDERTMRILLDGMVANPGPTGTMYPAQAWNIVMDHGLLLDGADSGWLMRDGRMLGANYAAHERLLGYLGIIAADAEAMGWARVSRRRGFKCMFRLSPEQRSALEDIGTLVDDGEERLKPRFVAAPPGIRNPFG